MAGTHRQLQPRRPDAVYAAEKDNNWNVYTVSLTRVREPYFFVSTVLKDEAVVATAAEEFQPAFSPDGKEIAYLENRQTLKVYNIASKQSRTVLPGDKNYSYADGDQYYQWSPDSKWLLVQFGPGNECLRRRSGSSPPTAPEVRNLTQSGYDDVTPKWAMDGKMMIWGTTREGAGQGGGAFGRRLRDVLHEGVLRSREALEGGIRPGQGARGKRKEGSRGKGQGQEDADAKPTHRRQSPSARSRSTGTA